MHDRPHLSIVVPFFNEEENIERLHAAVTNALENLGHSYELLFVDDGSRDGTLPIARSLAEIDSNLRILSFRRNYGQTPAMVAGIDHARGDVIVTMDGDLQNDPRDIRSFLQKLDEGYDIVVGWRRNRQDKLLTRKIPSMFANRLIGKITGVPIKDNGCSLKAFRAELIQGVPLYSDMHRFIPAMASVAGARIAEIGVRHHARKFGQSKYGLSRIYKVLLDLIAIKTVAGFFSRPGLWFALLSMPFAALGMLLSIYGTAEWILRDSFPLPLAGTGLLSLALAAFLIFGGALGELVYRTGDTRTEQFALVTGKQYVQDALLGKSPEPPTGTKS